MSCVTNNRVCYLLGNEFFYYKISVLNDLELEKVKKLHVTSIHISVLLICLVFFSQEKICSRSF